MHFFGGLTQQHGPRVVEHGLDDVVGQPGLPGAVVEHLAPDVIEVGIVDADHGPHIRQEALAVVDTAMGRHTGKAPGIFV